MIFNLLNVINDLTDPNNTPSGRGSLDLNNGGWIIIGVLIAIIFILILVISVLISKLDKYKESDKSKNHDIKSTDLSEEEKQTISEFRKLTDQEKQIINDTIKTFNKPKDE